MTYFATFLALTALMLSTVAISYVNLPGGVLANNLAAMAIAVVKAFLVIWIFMGIKWAPKLARLWAVAGFIVMPLMFIMFQDFFMRYQEQVPAWDSNQQESALPRKMDAKNPDEQVPNVGTGLRPRG